MQRFGKFEIRDLLGEGGFGRVFRAYDPDLKREVAIKTCRLADPTVRRRFLREAEIAAGLRHPNIVVVYELGEEGGEPFMVQEFLPGEDLESVITRQVPIAMERKVRWLRDVAEALAFAHEHGVIHRDVKPHNIRVLPDGSIRVLDFGIAKRSVDRASTALTQTGFSVGTLGYIAPEQLMGAAFDHRADIFSFGALAFRLMTFTDAFEGDTAATVFYKIANVHPAWPAHIARAYAPQLIACIDRCLAKRPEDRSQSCREVVDVLDSVLRGSDELPANAPARPGPEAAAQPAHGRTEAPGRGAGPTRRRALHAMAGTIVLIALGGLVRSTGGRTVLPDQTVIPGAPVPAPARSAVDSQTAVAGPQAVRVEPPAVAPTVGADSRGARVQPGTGLLAVFVDAGPAGAQLAPSARAAAHEALDEQLRATSFRLMTSSADAAADSSVLASARRLGRQIAVICRIAITDVTASNEFGMSSVTVTVSLVALMASTSEEVARAAHVATGAGVSAGAAAAAAVSRAMPGINAAVARDLNALRTQIRQGPQRSF